MSAIINAIRSVTDLFKAGEEFSKDDLKEMYKSTLPSFVSMLPYSGYDAETKTFVLEDLISRGISFTIKPIATEGKTKGQLADMRDLIEDIYNEFEELDKGRWVIQEFTYEDNSVDAIIDKMRDYVLPHAKGTVFTEMYIEMMERHFRSIQKGDGLYHDDQVTNQPWRFKMPRTKFLVYRRQTPGEVSRFNMGKHNPATEIGELCKTLESKFSQAGIRFELDDDISLFSWLFKLFNPKPDVSVFENKEEYYERMCDIDSEVLSGRDLCEALISEQPRSSVDDNCWYFNDRPTRFLRFSSLRKVPRIGALTGEVSSGQGSNESTYCVMDALPPNCIIAKTIVITPQPEFTTRFNKTKKSAQSASESAKEVAANLEDLSATIGTEHKKINVSMGVYISGENLDELEDHQRKALNVLNNAGLMLYKDKVDGLALKSFVNHLPFNFRPEQDNGYFLRSMWTQHCANMFLSFSRGEGTGNPCFCFFNRGGAPVFFDPFSKADHEATGFSMIFGPTGSGKSVTIANMVTSLAAMRKPRQFLIEYGDSFAMAAKDWKMKGMTVNYIKVMPETAPRLAPFGRIDSVLDAMDAQAIEKNIDDVEELEYVDINDSKDGEDSEDKKNTSKSGDILSELELVLLLMATGSEEAELARYTRADRSLLRRALVDTAKRQREKGFDQGLGKALPTVVTDIMETLSGYANDETLDFPETKRHFIKDIVLSLEAFTTGINHVLFNTPSEPWEDSDITVFNLGLLSQDGNIAQLNVAVLSLLQHINNLSEAYQFDARDVVTIIDEAHLLLNNQVLGKILTRVSKTARKLGNTPIFATQDVDDLKGESAKILNNMEWFYCLNFRNKEARKVAELCNLSPEDVHLMTSTKKKDRAYTEGVVISARHKIMFRSTPPSLMLTQAQTDKKEKSARTKWMRQNNVKDELEAVYEMANELDAARGIKGRIDYKGIKARCAV
jgi:conjugative transfer ATPase